MLYLSHMICFRGYITNAFTYYLLYICRKPYACQYRINNLFDYCLFLFLYAFEVHQHDVQDSRGHWVAWEFTMFRSIYDLVILYDWAKEKITLKCLSGLTGRFSRFDQGKLTHTTEVSTVFQDHRMELSTLYVTLYVTFIINGRNKMAHDYR